MCECCTQEKKDIYLPELATITKRRMLNGTELYMHLQLDGGQEMEYTPGQFVEVSLAGIGESPISISSTPTQKGLELVIRNVGTLTRDPQARRRRQARRPRPLWLDLPR